MEQQNYRTYEYMTVSASVRNANETADRYASLGWSLVRQADGIFCAMLTFKRDRNIKGKEQLNRLQVRIEDGVQEIAEMEESKTKGAMIFSLTFGIIAALIFGGGLSLIMFNVDPMNIIAVVGGVALGLIGGALAAITYPLYKKKVKRKIAKTNPLIEKKKDAIADLCGEASNLVSAA